MVGFRKTSLLAGAFLVGGAGAANEAWADSGSCSSNCRPVGATALAATLSEQVQSQRVYDSITGRVFERLVLGEAGSLNPTGVMSGEADLNRGMSAGETHVMQWGFWGSLGYDNVQFDNVEGSDHTLDLSGLWVGGDVLIDERLMLGLSIGGINLDGDVRHHDRISVNDSDVAPPPTFSYEAFLDGNGSESLDGIAIAPYAALILSPNFYIDGYASYSWLNSSTTDRYPSATQKLCTAIAPTACAAAIPSGGNVAAIWTFNETVEQRNDYNGLNLGINLNYIQPNAFAGWTVALSGGYQYIRSDTKNGAFHDFGTISEQDYNDTFFGNGSGTPIGGPVVTPFDSGMVPTGESVETFNLLRFNVRLDRALGPHVHVYGRGALRYMVDELGIRNSQVTGWDLDNSGTLSPSELNTHQSVRTLQQTTGTIEAGAMFMPTEKTRIRLGALTDVGGDINRWGVNASFQYRF